MAWVLLITTMRGRNGGLRLRLWRQLKAVGAEALRDGVYLLPDSPARRAVLEQLRDQLVAAAGAAYVVPVPEQETGIESTWRALFDRAAQYRHWSQAVQALLDAPPATESDARRQLRQRGRELDTLRANDFFPGTASAQAERLWSHAQRTVIRQYSPDEPVPEPQHAVPRLSPDDFKGRRWATRARPWVDRVASAWLIARFIDRGAQFLWLADSKACPADALGFDFDGARFSHVGELVTFQVLLASFGLDRDAALVRIGAMVRTLDLNLDPSPEAAGFEMLLKGARNRLANDDELLREMSSVLDSLYAYC